MNILAKVHADNTKFATTTVRDTPGYAAFFEFWKIHEIGNKLKINQTHFLPLGTNFEKKKILQSFDKGHKLSKNVQSSTFF